MAACLARLATLSARLDDYRTGAETLASADLTNRKTFEACYNQRPLAEIPAAFRRARAQAIRAKHSQENPPKPPATNPSSAA